MVSGRDYGEQEFRYQGPERFGKTVVSGLERVRDKIKNGFER